MQLAERRRAAAARRKEAASDPEVRRLEAAITARLRPVTADEEEVAALAANETRYLGLALGNYRRCARNLCSEMRGTLQHLLKSRIRMWTLASKRSARQSTHSRAHGQWPALAAREAGNRSCTRPEGSV